MDNLELLHAWEIAKAQGRRLADFSEDYGISHKAMQKRLGRARKRLETTTTIPEDKITITPEGVNELVVHYSGKRIITDEDLIAAATIDLDIWQITDAKWNKYEGYRKAKQVDITYNEGVANGKIVDSGGLNIQPLFKVEIKARRKSPLPLNPVIQPAEVNLSGIKFPKPSASSKQGITRTLHISDPHFGYSRQAGELVPFHDRDCLALVLTLINTMSFDKAVISGDILDLPDWTDKYLRSPEMKFCTQPAIIEAAWFIAQIRKAIPVVGVVEGNHDERIHKSMLTNFRHGYGIKPADRLDEAAPMSIPGLLGLERMGVDYYGDYPNGFMQIAGDLIVEHGNKVSGDSGATVTKVLKNILMSTGFGHIHRLEIAQKTIQIPGKPERYIQAYSPACLCHIDGRVPGSTRKCNWQNGLAIIETYEGQSQIDLYQIQGARALIRGSVFKVNFDYMRELTTDTQIDEYLN